MDTVLQRWRIDYSASYSEPRSDNEDIVHRNCINAKINLKHGIAHDDRDTNISFAEVDNVIDKLKSNKAVEIDLISNEILKCVDFKTY